MMRTWTRDGYEVVEAAMDHDLHQFEVIQDGELVATIVPPDMESMQQIIEDLDAGEDVNGWEDGMGNSIHIEKKCLTEKYTEWRKISEEMLEDGHAGSVDCGEAAVREDFSAFAGLTDIITFDEMHELEREYEESMGK